MGNLTRLAAAARGAHARGGAEGALDDAVDAFAQNLSIDGHERVAELLHLALHGSRYLLHEVDKLVFELGELVFAAELRSDGDLGLGSGRDHLAEIGEHLPDVIECVFDVLPGVFNLVDERLCLVDQFVKLFDLVFNLFMPFVGLLPRVLRPLTEFAESLLDMPAEFLAMLLDMLAEFLAMLLDMLETLLDTLAEFLETLLELLAEPAELSVVVIIVVSSVHVLRGRGDVQLRLQFVVILLVDDELVHTMYGARAPEGR